AAGCFLPLSRNLQVGRALGTRHRAALGITEETDAIAIVVSEETGRVSLAVEGQMDSPVEAGSLRQRLLALLGGTPVPARRPSGGPAKPSASSSRPRAGPPPVSRPAPSGCAPA